MPTCSDPYEFNANELPTCSDPNELPTCSDANELPTCSDPNELPTCSDANELPTYSDPNGLPALSATPKANAKFRAGSSHNGYGPRQTPIFSGPTEVHTRRHLDKGTRVNIVDGQQGKGQSGTVFWTGKNKWGDGERLGVRGDDGETYWVSDADVETTTEAAPEQPAGDTFEKGDRVSFTQRGQQGTGTVFWLGQSRNGPGQRLGVRDDNGEEAVWIDARLAKALDGDAPAAQPRPQNVSSHDESESDQTPDAWSPDLDISDMPPSAPMDDSSADQWAAWDEEQT